MEHNIAFTGPEFVANTSYKKGENHRCNALARFGRWGCIVQLNVDGEPVVCASAPREVNLVAAWRASEVLALLPFIDDSIICEVILAVTRLPKHYLVDTGREEAIDALCEVIGEKAFDDIMSLSVPDGVIWVILSNQAAVEGLPVPGLESLRREAAHGLIEWRDEFAGTGAQELVMAS